MRNVITIKRIPPPLPKHKNKHSIKEIMDAARKVKKAVEKEEMRYGKLSFTCE